MELSELEVEVLALFQEKGMAAESEIEKWMKPDAAPKKRAIMRSILSRLYVRSNGTYFLK